MDAWNIISSVGSMGTAFGAIFVACQIWQTKNQAVTNFEDSLDREYREIINHIPVKVFLGQSLDEKEYQDALPCLYRYIDLSNNQVFLRQIGRVSDETWSYWRDGIRSNLAREPFRTAWKEIKGKGQPSFSELKRLEIDGFRDDPKKWSNSH